ncbi:MAG: thioredoxin family protein [Chitinispirillia bacterium]|nr:thioredoxin family protein [Chitinispirillia bacterium]
MELSFQPGKARYNPGDTVVVGIEVSIPRSFHLYGNPLGPGIGKPLKLTVDQNKNIEWIEAKKSAAKRFNPPIGDWVWAYQSKAYFFIKGVLSEDFFGDSIKSEIEIDALICKTMCIPVIKRAVFYLSIDNDADAQNFCSLAFPNAPDWQTRYEKSEPMEFLSGIQHSEEPRPPQGILGGINLNLEGLSSLEKDNELSSDEDHQLSSEEILIWDYSPLRSQKDYNLLTAILIALLAGLALNITPCVFPMLGIRALSFVQGAGESRRRAFLSGLFFAGGIVSVFMLLAGLAAFAGFSWGQQFQNPYVMAGIIALIFLFSLGMFHYYDFALPSGIANAGVLRRVGSGLGGDFFKGMIATVLATPCGGPFLGALLAWALLQEPLTIFVLFMAMGIGMAVPYVLLSTSRRLLNLLPKPGRWMEDFKHFMGFLLIIFAIYLMKSLDMRLITMTIGICFAILCAASVNKRFAPFGVSLSRRIIVSCLSIILLLTGTVFSVIFLPVKSSSSLSSSANSILSDETVWIPFSPEALKNAHAQGQNAIVNFTASWCSACQINKAVVLNNRAVINLHAEKNAVLFTADITNKNPQAESLLHHLGSRSIPFLAIFPADSYKEPVVMHGSLSKNKYMTAIKKLP